MFRELSFCSVLNLQFQAKMSAVSFHHECKCTVKEYFHENVKKNDDEICIFSITLIGFPSVESSA